MYPVGMAEEKSREPGKLAAGLSIFAIAAIAAQGLALAPREPWYVTLGCLAALAAPLGCAVSRVGLASTRWIAFLVSAAIVAALGEYRWGGAPPALVALMTLQVAAGAAAPSRTLARLGALGIGSGVGLAGLVAHGGTLDSLAVAALGLAAADLVAARTSAEDVARRPEPAPTIGKTRMELARARVDLDELAHQLQRETDVRQRAEVSALEALRTRNAFLAAMSHELRTPLSQIIGYSELLLEEVPGDRSSGDIERLHLASLGLLEVIGNILDMSRLEAGKETVEVESFSAAELVENLIQSMSVLARRRGNLLRVRCSEELSPLRTDRAKLRTIVANLVSNACKFTSDGTIRIAVSELTHAGVGMVEIAVSDTGIGIAADQVERIFTPFVQVDQATTRRYDGSGLGLAISRQYCHMLGGEITVESEPGRGSIFRVRIPREFVDPRGTPLVQRSIG